jgi:8-oxo-dGTP diphosphatase
MENNKKLIEVVAALIWRGEKFMICQRPANKARGLLWEFVGGKVEQGESLAHALVRECREELAITIQPSEIFAQLTHEYPDVIVHLTIFNATIKEGEPQLLEHNDLKWIIKEQISNFTFCPADEEILDKIANLK